MAEERASHDLMLHKVFKASFEMSAVPARKTGALQSEETAELRAIRGGDGPAAAWSSRARFPGRGDGLCCGKAGPGTGKGGLEKAHRAKAHGPDRGGGFVAPDPHT